MKKVHCAFFVQGKPAPQGSKIAKCINGKAVMWESSNDVKPWRNAITIEALKQEALDADTAIDIVLEFLLPQPKTVNRALPTVKPDLDKLVRSTLDGLTTSGIFGDDARVVKITATKSYAKPDQEIGCWIYVGEADV